MATLALTYSVLLTTALTPIFGLWFLATSVPFVAVSAIPLLSRGSRAFNGTCYAATVLLVFGACFFGGLWFLPAVLPLLFATPPGLSAPIPQACVATVLAVIAVTLLNLALGLQ